MFLTCCLDKYAFAVFSRRTTETVGKRQGVVGSLSVRLRRSTGVGSLPELDGIDTLTMTFCSSRKTTRREGVKLSPSQFLESSSA